MRLSAFAVACSLFLSPAAFAEGAAKIDAGKGSTRLTSAVSFVPLPTISAATPAGRAIGGMLTVDFALDIPDARLRNRAISMRPRLMDSLRATVADYALTRVRAGAPPDPDMISTLAQTGLDHTIGPGAKVLITNVMIVDRR